MQFLDTTPFRYDTQLDFEQRAAIEHHRVRDPRRLARTLADLKNLEAPIRVGLPATGDFFTATLWSVDTEGDHLVFHASRDPLVHAIVTNPARLWAAAYDGSRKVQFDVHSRTITPQNDFWVVGARLPSAMYLLPRRADVRTRHAAGHEPRVRFADPAEPLLELEPPIYDISAGGFSFLLPPGQARLAVGAEVCGAEMELAPGDFLFADFRIRNVQQHDEDGGSLRFGCVWTLLSPEATRTIERWTQRSRQRRQMLSLDL